ncbi:MAG: glutamyl-tRNA synthetase [Candidatus Diapherotrites archaeon]|nr:glutamyl-tRNA synthetase [Candidatus Diapherotrites archaeon]
MKEVYELAYKYALKNAVDHGGKAAVGAVVGKIFVERPELKERAKEIIPIVKKAVEAVNKLTLEQQKKEMEKHDYSALKKEERKGLPELPNVKGTVVTRFPPEPGGYIHLGNLRSALVSYLYAKKYNGRFILRFEDTNPAKPKLPYYDAIREDLKAVGIKWDKEIIESDRMELYYKYARKLIEVGKAYVCTCSPEEMKKHRENRTACPHRDQSVEENLELWDKMLEGAFGEGEAVLRLKIDPAHKNPAMRDPVLFRIITSVPHPRTGYKYHVYPLYNFACAVEDGLEVTHVLRGKEHQTNGEIQKIIQNALGLNVPEFVHFGRIHVEDKDSSIPMGKRYIRQALREGVIEGWGDVKIPTVRALLNRGILPETLWEFFEEIGPKKSDLHVDMEYIYGINRKKLDERAKRFFFVEDPVELIVENAPAVEARIPYHPDHPEYGERIYKFPEGDHRLFIARKDVPKKGEEIRLMHLYNVTVKDVGERVVAEYSGDEIKRIQKIQWVPVVGESTIDAEILHPSGEKISGIVEYWAQGLKEGDIVQLERVCFARVRSNQGEKITFYWTHR